MNELVQAIQNLGQNNVWDYIQIAITILSTAISATALFLAIKVPTKIAKQQNKIALFEKRYTAFQLFEKCIIFCKSLQVSETTEEMKKGCLVFFDDLEC